MHRRLIVIGIAYCCFVSRAIAANPATVAATATALPEQRWALLASDELWRSGFADVLVVHLNDLPSVRWLERERLGTVAAELVGNAIAGTDQASSRLKLGRLLGADALLIVKPEGDGKGQRLRVVVTDCHTGARLADEISPYPEGRSPERSAGAVRDVVQQTRARFAGGIRSIIGVPPFVSRDFSHEFDPLQAGFAQIVANALMTVPGVAVIEVDEAQALARELAGAPLGDRVVPTTVSGEFKTSGASRGDGVRVSLRLSWAPGGGKEPLAISGKDLPLAEAANLLSTELPRAILASLADGAGTPLSIEQQFAALAERAATFARYGAWEHSLPLREAALLLRPDDAPQRLAAAEEYVITVESRPPDELDVERTRAAFVRWSLTRLAAWQRAREHVEMLIRRRQIRLEPLCALMYRHTPTLDTIPTWALDELAPRMADLARENDYFVREVFPRAADLPRVGKLPEHWALDAWQRELLRAAMLRLSDPQRHDAGAVRPAELTLLADLMNGPLGDTAVGLDTVGEVVYNAANDVAAGKGKISDSELRAFLDRLCGSPSPKPRLYGRAGRLWKEWVVRRRARDTNISQLRADAAQLDAEVKAAFPKLYNPLEHYSSLLVTDIDRTLRAAAAATNPSLAKPSTTRRSRPPVAAAPGPAETRELIFEPVVFTVRDGHGGMRPLAAVALGNPKAAADKRSFISSVQPCGSRFDVVVSRPAVYLHRDRGVLDEVLADPAAEYISAAWDGEHVWVRSLHQGLFVLAPDGRLITRVSAEHGLPPASGGMLFHPVSSDKMLIVASHGEHARAWCAIVQLDDDVGPRVHVFHQATQVAKPEDRAVLKDATLCFYPRFIRAMSAPAASGGARVLVGRAVPGFSDTLRYPLEIDLKALTVGVREHTGLGGFTPFPYLLDDDQVIVPFSRQLIVFTGAQRPPTTRPSRPPEGPPRSPALVELRDGAFLGIVPPIEYAGHVYFPGSTWCRVDTKSLRTTSLTLPPGRRGVQQRVDWMRYGVSAHYGMITWNGNDQSIHAMRVDGDSPARVPPASAPMVPTSRQRRNRRWRIAAAARPSPRRHRPLHVVDPARHPGAN